MSCILPAFLTLIIYLFLIVLHLIYHWHIPSRKKEYLLGDILRIRKFFSSSNRHFASQSIFALQIPSNPFLFSDTYRLYLTKGKNVSGNTPASLHNGFVSSSCFLNGNMMLSEQGAFSHQRIFQTLTPFPEGSEHPNKVGMDSQESETLIGIWNTLS